MSNDVINEFLQLSEGAKLRAVNAELLAALVRLVNLHKDWDKGSAYVPVSFMEKNNAAIADARAAIAKARGE